MRKISAALSWVISFFLLVNGFSIFAQNTSPYWSLSGNSNTSATSKLGTTNASNLAVYTNNLERVRVLSANGYVGIGTITPGARLEVSGTDKMAAKFNSNNSSMFIGLYKRNALKGYVGSSVNFNNDVDFGTSQNNTLGKVHFTTRNISRVTIDTNGNFGINTQFPNVRLSVKQFEQNRAIQMQHETKADLWNMGIGTNTLFFRFEYNYNFRANISNVDGSYIMLSDRKVKEDIQPMEKTLERLNKLQASTYYYKNSRSYATKKSIGFIAQEVEKEFPELVFESDEGYKTVNYTGLTVVAIKALQEQEEKIMALTEKLKKLNDIEKELAELKQVVSSLNNQRNSLSQEGFLEQNTPNPFNSNSIIRYFVPTNSRNARLVLTDNEGRSLKQINLSNFGKGQVSLGSSGLSAGTYTYSLYIDGKLADSKRLIIAK
jgi:hypothetical protein